MKFLADECCDKALVEVLREDGHDVLYATESLQGEPDEIVLARAFSENRLLITEDKDFGELVYRLKKPTQGIILLRFDISDRDFKIPRLRELLKHESQKLFGSFVVLETEKVRIRSLH